MYYNALFCESLEKIEKIATNYSTFWSKMDGSKPFNNNCSPCALLQKQRGGELINYYYSCAPLIPEIIVDIATVLLSTLDNEIDIGREIPNLHPFSIVYHFFLNCCFTDKEEKTTTANLFIETASRYWCFDEINFKRISYLLNKKSLDYCDGKCGQFKEVITKISASQDSFKKNVSFAGETIVDDNVGTKEMENIKRYSEQRLKIAFNAVKNAAATNEDNDETINAFECFQSCKICSALPLFKHHHNFSKWEIAYVEMTKKLIGSNTLTNINETLKESPFFLKGVTSTDIFNHETNHICRCNVKRCVQFFNTFSDTKKISNQANVKHVTSIFLKNRDSLICSDLYFAIWLEKIMCKDKNVYNDKISGYIYKVYSLHG